MKSGIKGGSAALLVVSDERGGWKRRAVTQPGGVLIRQHPQELNPLNLLRLWMHFIRFFDLNNPLQVKYT
jgi:hypothetical protein